MGNSHSKKHPILEVEHINTNEEKDLKYYLLNNLNDIDRQHAHTFIKKEAFQNSFSVPIEERLIQGDCKVLDVCCGPGTWLLDLASKYEKSSFFGIDIMSIYPNEIKPANLNFIQADILNGIPFPDNEFDFVNQETMKFILRIDQWDFVLSELVRVTRPGGYIQISETACIFNEKVPNFRRIMEDGFYACSLERNVDLRITSNLKAKLESQQNIIKVQQDQRTIIIGPNGGKLGMVMQETYLNYISNEAAIETIHPYLGMSKEELKDFMNNDLINEFKENYPEYVIYRFWAQKNIN